MKMENKTIVLAKFADDGIPTADNFKIVTSTVESPKNDGDVLFQTLAMSADPYLRGGIKSDGGKKIGDPMLGFVAGKVVESKNPKWEKGDLFGGTLAFSTYNFVPAAYMSQVRSCFCACWCLRSEGNTLGEMAVCVRFAFFVLMIIAGILMEIEWYCGRERYLLGYWSSGYARIHCIW